LIKALDHLIFRCQTICPYYVIKIKKRLATRSQNDDKNGFNEKEEGEKMIQEEKF